MKTLRLNNENLKIAGFKYGLASYGTLLDSKGNRKYRIEVNIPSFFGIDGFAIYRSGSKPMFRNLFIISILWLPFWALSILLLSTVATIFFAYGYFIDTVIGEWSISGTGRRIYGLVTLIFYTIGLYSTVWFFFFR